MPIQVLIADDHRLLRESLRRAMADEGLEVVGIATNGVEAVELAGALRPDVVLMDITMPEMDGLEAAARIGKDLPGLPVLMLTMHADAEFVRHAVNAGAAGYLVKDASSRTIADAVRRVAAGEQVFGPTVAPAADDVR